MEKGKRIWQALLQAVLRQCGRETENLLPQPWGFPGRILVLFRNYYNPGALAFDAITLSSTFSLTPSA
ncbi:MAG: hypothetical protein OSJ28_02290 [Desulfovibrio sp.]|nr:hypothetical protein [Desulfovibrio sp.]